MREHTSIYIVTYPISVIVLGYTAANVTPRGIYKVTIAYRMERVIVE